MNTKLLALYGLKWHPFTTEVPTEAIHVPARLEHFCWRIEQGLIREGGFAMIHGDPGTGKSVALRLLAERLAPGGILHLATDWQPYAEQMLAVLSAEPLLANSAAGYAERPAYRPETKFERRGLRLGHGVWDLVFRRRPAA